MRKEQKNKVHLTPRQIINRYRKGEYIDESIEAISSAVSSCSLPLNSIAVPFPDSIIEKVYENIGTCKTMYELRKEGKSIDGIEVPHYPQLNDILVELSEPALWESMMDEKGIAYIDIIRQQGLYGRYILDSEIADAHKIESYFTFFYRDAIRECGIYELALEMVLSFMLRKPNKE